jgi:hypothetical protein
MQAPQAKQVMGPSPTFRDLIPIIPEGLSHIYIYQGLEGCGRMSLLRSEHQWSSAFLKHFLSSSHPNHFFIQTSSPKVRWGNIAPLSPSTLHKKGTCYLLGGRRGFRKKVMPVASDRRPWQAAHMHQMDLVFGFVTTSLLIFPSNILHCWYMGII